MGVVSHGELNQPSGGVGSMTAPPVGAPIDANGNLTSDGTRSFEWDARNQLVAVTVGTHRSEFIYDGLQRRVRQVEKDSGATTADTWVLWCETAICEERAADGVTVTRRAFGLGEQVNGQARFFTTDHLGSVREDTDSTGTLLARYAFDPWGRRTVTAGADITTVGFTGHRTDTSPGLTLALYRGYDAGFARWVSEDPLGIGAGGNHNLFGYVENRVVVLVDPLGLKSAIPLVDYCMRHYYRNAHNSYPVAEPTSSPQWKKDFHGSGKYRSDQGYECAYDACGKLKPDDGQNYTYNYGPSLYTATHVILDVLPHYLCGPVKGGQTRTTGG